MRRCRAALSLALVGMAAMASMGCSDDDSSSPDTTAPTSTPTTSASEPVSTESTTTALDASSIEASEEFCAAAQSLVDLDARTTPLMNTIIDAADNPPASGDTVVQATVAQLEALEPELIDAYDALAGTAPPELAAAIADFRSGSLAVLAALQEAAETGDVETAMAGLDVEVSQRAVEGARLVSGVTQENCDFSITD